MATLGQLLERRAEAIVVALEVLRKLPQDRPELRRVRQRLERVEESLRAALSIVSQAA